MQARQAAPHRIEPRFSETSFDARKNLVLLQPHMIVKKLRHPRNFVRVDGRLLRQPFLDRKSTRLNSSHPSISYAVFCLKKKKNTKNIYQIHIKTKKKKTKTQK